MNYDIKADLKTIREILSLTYQEMGRKANIPQVSLIRWENGEVFPSDSGLEAVYSFAYRNSFHPIRLNSLKAQLRSDDKGERILLFHGAEGLIDGKIDTNHARRLTDFGPGFYAGESYEQAGTFVAGRPGSSVYTLYFQPSDKWKSISFSVGLEWLFAVAFFRNRINNYASSPLVTAILKKITEADYLIAPIADNMMYETIDSFVQGFITSEQCLHCLSAAKLGRQFVFLNNRICNELQLADRLYLCKEERKDLLEIREKTKAEGIDKNKASLIKYRGQGKYIEEILKNEKI